jgi:DNA-binding XRE family transcriptional regulator
MLDDKKLYAELGKRIQHHRRSRLPVMSQEKLAGLVGLTRTSVTNIERGKQKITLDTVYKLCETFEIAVSELLPVLGDVLTAEQSVVVAGQHYALPARTASSVKRYLPDDPQTPSKPPTK